MSDLSRDGMRTADAATLRLDCRSHLATARDTGLTLSVYTGQRGSAAEEKLHLLASWPAPDAAADHVETSHARP